ncbi:hypothetical protein EV174_006987, partial [Coemansia sp. RSA 2320]
DYYQQPAATYAAPAANYAPVYAPAPIVQNAATVEPTVTVTVTNGAAGKALSIGSALLAGTFVVVSYL